MANTSIWLLRWAIGMFSAFAVAPLGAQAQLYPGEDIHFVTGFPPGSGLDIVTRYFAEKVRLVANRTVIVENKVGAAGSIALEYVARAKPDGYTMLLSAGSGTAAGMHLQKNPPVDELKAFQIAATINRQGFMLVVDAKSPYKTVQELTAYLKTKGDKASYATVAPSGIVMGELYKQITGVQAVEVRYKDAVNSLNEMQSGKLDYGMQDPMFSVAQQREGRLRALAHSAGKRLDAVPDMPTMAESGVTGMDLTSWLAVHLQSGTPRPVIDQINAWFKQILETKETADFLHNLGSDPFISTPDEAQALFIKDEKAWGEYVRLAKIEPQ